MVRGAAQQSQGRTREPLLLHMRQGDPLKVVQMLEELRQNPQTRNTPNFPPQTSRQKLGTVPMWHHTIVAQQEEKVNY